MQWECVAVRKCNFFILISIAFPKISRFSLVLYREKCNENENIENRFDTEQNLINSFQTLFATWILFSFTSISYKFYFRWRSSGGVTAVHINRL